MRTMEEALAWCMEHDVTVKFVTHGLTIGVQVYEYTSDIADGMTLGFGKTFLEAVQEAAGIEAQNGAQAKHDLDAEIRQVQETALTDAEVDKRIEAYNAGLAPKVDEIAALREIVKEVSEDYWVVGEVYNKCFFCGACFDEEESDHQEDCLAMRAKRLLRKSTLTLPLAEARGSRKLEVHVTIPHD